MSNENWTKKWEEGEDLEDLETFEPLKQYVTGSAEDLVITDEEEETDEDQES